jgi:hypothetical protein
MENSIRNGGTREQGVSEALGFMLIFTMVIVGIGLVTLYGYPMLLRQQVSADEKIMEKNMIVLQNDIKSLAYKTVPYKETALKIGGGTLTVYNASSSPTSATFDITDPAGNPYISTFHSGDLRYESIDAQTDVSLQNGAVVLRDRLGQGSTMLAEPRWFYDESTNTMVINLISINSTGIMSRTGIGTVQMAMGETTYQYIPIPIGDHIMVKYTREPDPDGQDYSQAWRNYFTNTMMMTPTEDSNVYQLPTSTSKPATLVIKKYDVVIKSV